MKKKNSLLHRLYRDNSHKGPGRNITRAEISKLYIKAKEKYPDGKRGNKGRRLDYLAENLFQNHPSVFKKKPSRRTIHEWLIFLKVHIPKYRTIVLPDPDHSAVFALTMRRTTSEVTDEQYEHFRYSLSYIIQPEHKFQRHWPRHSRIEGGGQGATVLDITCDERLSTWFACSATSASMRKQQDKMLADVEAVVFHSGKGLETQEAVDLFISNVRKSMISSSDFIGQGPIDYAIRLVIVPRMHLIRP